MKPYKTLIVKARDGYGAVNKLKKHLNMRGEKLQPDALISFGLSNNDKYDVELDSLGGHTYKIKYQTSKLQKVKRMKP